MTRDAAPSRFRPLWLGLGLAPLFAVLSAVPFGPMNLILPAVLGCIVGYQCAGRSAAQTVAMALPGLLFLALLSGVVYALRLVVRMGEGLPGPIMFLGMVAGSVGCGVASCVAVGLPVALLARPRAAPGGEAGASPPERPQ